MIDTGPVRAPQTSTAATHSGGRMAHLRHSQATGRRPQRLTRCALAVSAAKPGEDGVPPTERRVSRRSKLPHAKRSPFLAASVSYVLEANSTSNAASHAQRPSSATLWATRPLRRSISAPSSRPSQRRQHRSTALFRGESCWSAARGRGHPYMYVATGS